MAIDFNDAEEQREGTGQAIPPESIVPFKMTIRPPKAGKEGTTHSLFCKSPKGNEYIDCEFEVQGQFAGRKVWQNFTLVGSETAAKISMATLRAIVESSRNISPKDTSPAAAVSRKLSDWADFNGMVFLARVKCVVDQSTKDGQWYVNNELAKVITPDMKEYAAGEAISGKPLPAIPEAGSAPAAKGPTATSTWGKSPDGPAPTGPAEEPADEKKKDPMPAWAAR